MLINDQVIKQGDEAKSFVSGLFGSFSGLSGSKKDASDANTIAANPLTGTALTAPTAAAPVSIPPSIQASLAVRPMIKISSMKQVRAGSSGNAS